MSGVKVADQARAKFLCELALAGRVLQMRKPLSSRDRSREQYLLARGYRGGIGGEQSTSARGRWSSVHLLKV